MTAILGNLLLVVLEMAADIAVFLLHLLDGCSGLTEFLLTCLQFGRE